MCEYEYMEATAKSVSNFKSSDKSVLSTQSTKELDEQAKQTLISRFYYFITDTTGLYTSCC